MGTQQSTPTEVTGQSNANVIVEQSMDKVDLMHSILLFGMLGIILLQCGYLAYRHNQKRMKRRYLERQKVARNGV